MSSDSEGYDHPFPSRSRASRRLPTPPLSPRGQQNLSDSALTQDTVSTLNTTLRDTKRNIREVDRMLGRYRDASDSQSTAINRLRENLARSSDRLREERLQRGVLRDSRPLRSSDLEEEGPSRRYRPTSPLRDYGEVGDYTRRRRKKKSSSVRFEAEPEELHDIHQTLRDLSSDQIRIGEDLEREIDRRKQLDYDNRRVFTDITESMRRSRVPEESVSSRVEKRLKEIEEEMKTQRMSRKVREPVDSTSMISTEVVQALRSQTADEERQLRDRLMKSEADRQHMYTEFETTKRKLDQSEGSRNALKQQIEDLHDQLSRSDHSKTQMKDQISEYASVLEEEGLPLSRQARRERKLQEERHKQDVEKQKLEREIEHLKSQLTRSSGIRELDDTKRELEKSERQRVQLSDHMEALSHDLESKEKYQAKLINQLKDVTDKYEDSDRQRQLAMAQLEETQKRLRETNREADMLADKLRDTQRFLEDAEKKKDEMKMKAQETVRQWKQKCKKLDKDVDRYKHSGEQLMARNEKLARENEINKSSSSTNVQRLESLHRELNEALAIRAQQDEQLRMKDIEVNEMKSMKMDLEKELRDTRAFMEKLDNELQTQMARQASLKEEKMYIAEEMSSMKSTFQQSQDQVNQLHVEMREVSVQKAELTSRLAEEMSARQDLESRLKQLREQENVTRDEMTKLVREVKQEQEIHSNTVSELRRELQHVKAREEQSIQDVAHKMKRENAELEAEIQTIKMQRADDKCTVKALRRQGEKMKSEMEKVGEDLAKTQDENNRLKKKYERLKQGFEENIQRAEEGENRTVALDKLLEQTQGELHRHQADCENTLHIIGSEIDLLARITSKTSEDKFSMLTPPTRGIYTDTQKWLADKKSKLHWLQEEARSRHDSERLLKSELNRSRNDIHETIRASDKDRQFYQTELQRQEEILQEVHTQKIVLEANNQQTSQKVVALEDQIAELGQQIQLRAKALERSLDSIPENDTSVIPEIQKDFQQLQDLQKERDKINERYNKYKETIGILHQQLQEAKKTADDRRKDKQESSFRGTKHATWSPPTPQYKRRVQISESQPTVIHSSPVSPPTQGHGQRFPSVNLDISPMNWSYSRSRRPMTGSTSPEPLSLSDTEFKQRFLPPMPSFSVEAERELVALS
ncbi:uncharacterized protein LOC144453511 [Glandiceps talaboti]